MRRRNFFIGGLVAIITFFSLQAFVRPYVGNRFGWGYHNRYYYHRGPGWAPRDYYNYRHHGRDNNRQPYDTPRHPEDSAHSDIW